MVTYINQQIYHAHDSFHILTLYLFDSLIILYDYKWMTSIWGCTTRCFFSRIQVVSIKLKLEGNKITITIFVYFLILKNLYRRNNKEILGIFHWLIAYKSKKTWNDFKEQFHLRHSLLLQYFSSINSFLDSFIYLVRMC